MSGDQGDALRVHEQQLNSDEDFYLAIEGVTGECAGAQRRVPFGVLSRSARWPEYSAAFLHQSVDLHRDAGLDAQ